MADINSSTRTPKSQVEGKIKNTSISDYKSQLQEGHSRGY